jgi:hypothetical protein
MPLRSDMVSKEARVYNSSSSFDTNVGQGFKDLYFSKHTGTEPKRVQNDRDKAISLPTWFHEISSCRIV